MDVWLATLDGAPTPGLRTRLTLGEGRGAGYLMLPRTLPIGPYLVHARDQLTGLTESQPITVEP